MVNTDTTFQVKCQEKRQLPADQIRRHSFHRGLLLPHQSDILVDLFFQQRGCHHHIHNAHRLFQDKRDQPEALAITHNQHRPLRADAIHGRHVGFQNIAVRQTRRRHRHHPLFAGSLNQFIELGLHGPGQPVADADQPRQGDRRQRPGVLAQDTDDALRPLRIVIKNHQRGAVQTFFRRHQRTGYQLQPLSREKRQLFAQGRDQGKLIGNLLQHSEQRFLHRFRGQLLRCHLLNVVHVPLVDKVEKLGREKLFMAGEHRKEHHHPIRIQAVLLP